MNAQEITVTQAYKLYQIRDHFRRSLGAEYRKTIEEVIQMVKGYMQKHGTGDLESAIAMAKNAEGGARFLLLAAAVEMIEPSVDR